MGKKSELLPKYEAFCREYVIDFNGAQACIRAGYSVKSAKEQASRLLTIANVKARIAELKAELADKNAGLVQAVIDELKKVGFSNVVDYLEEENVIADLITLPKEKTAAVSSIKKTVTDFDGGTKTSVEFKLHDKISALEKIGRHLGIFEADNSQKKPVITVNLQDE